MKFAWQERRKIVRDRYRAKFWSDIGITPLKDVSALQADASPFITEALGRLTQPSDALTGDDSAFLQDVQAQLSGLALGMPSGFTMPSTFGSKSHSFNAMFDGWFRVNEVRVGTSVRQGTGWTNGKG